MYIMYVCIMRVKSEVGCFHSSQRVSMCVYVMDACIVHEPQ